MADTSARFAIIEPSADRSDPADVPLYIRNIVAALEALGTIYGQGTLAARPVSTVGSPGKQGRFYFATDDGNLYYDTGTSWNVIGVTTIADGSITGGPAGAGVKIATATITHDNIVAGTIRGGGNEIAAASITAADIANALKPSAGAGGGTEALRALGTAAGTAAAGDDSRFSNVVPVGAVMDWPWDSGDIPAWTALCYGQAITETGHSALNTLDDNAGHPHGVSAGNIVMPDYRGRVGAGKDNMGGSTASRITAAISGITGTTLGAVGGSEGVTLTTAQLAAHNHGITGAPGISDPAHGHQSRIDNNGGAGGITTAQKTTNAAERFTDNLTTIVGTGINVSAGTLATSNNGSGSAHANVGPTIIVNKIMRII